jgi:heme A synthase
VFATLAIIVLIPRSHAAWIVALHRFFEVSVEILVALALAAVWPERTTRIRKREPWIICAFCLQGRCG